MHGFEEPCGNSLDIQTGGIYLDGVGGLAKWSDLSLRIIQIPSGYGLFDLLYINITAACPEFLIPSSCPFADIGGEKYFYPGIGKYNCTLIAAFGNDGTGLGGKRPLHLHQLITHKINRGNLAYIVSNPLVADLFGYVDAVQRCAQRTTDGGKIKIATGENLFESRHIGNVNSRLHRGKCYRAVHSPCVKKTESEACCQYLRYGALAASCRAVYCYNTVFQILIR